MVDTVILLGGNLGDVRANLAKSRELIESRVGRIVARSAEVESEAWGFSSTDKFVNQALRVQTTLTPEELLIQTQRIEIEVGRDRAEEIEQKRCSAERYASRVIDVDIITYAEAVIRSERLIIPHERMHERAFVLNPMVEVAPEWRHPILDMTTVELLKKL